MKFRVDPKPPKDKTQWHHWFAWYPVRVGPFIVWLAFVERRGKFHDDSCGGFWDYEYQEATWYV